jgi:hypothetical protein
MEKFRQKSDILEAKRQGFSLFEIYLHLEDSKDLLKQENKNSFEIINDLFLDPFTEESALEFASFPIESLSIYASKISPSHAKILVTFRGQNLEQ